MSLCVQSLTNFFPHFYSNRREALLLPSLQQGVCGQVQSQGSPTDPFGCEKIPMQELLQNLLQDVSSAQTWGIWLLCSTLNWDTFSTTTKKTNEREKTPSSLSSLLFFLPKPRRTVGESHQSGFVHKFTDFFFFLLLPADFISECEIAQCSQASRFKQCFCDCNQCRALSNHVLTYLCYSCTFLHV